MNLRSVSFGLGIHFLLRERFFVTGQRNFPQKLFTGGEICPGRMISAAESTVKKKSPAPVRGPDLLPNILAEGDAVF